MRRSGRAERGIQRELTKDMALEIRYVGNHGTRLWGQTEIGEGCAFHPFATLSNVFF